MEESEEEDGWEATSTQESTKLVSSDCLHVLFHQGGPESTLHVCCIWWFTYRRNCVGTTVASLSLLLMLHPMAQCSPNPCQNR